MGRATKLSQKHCYCQALDHGKSPNVLERSHQLRPAKPGVGGGGDAVVCREDKEEEGAEGAEGDIPEPACPVGSVPGLVGPGAPDPAAVAVELSGSSRAVIS